MIELFKEIAQTAKRNKLRTALTGFAVAWGIFMLVVLLGAGNGLINAQLNQSARFLSNSMMVFGGRTSKAYQGLKEGRRIRLQTRDISTTDAEFKDIVDEVGAQYSASVTISNGQEYIATEVTGVYPNHTKIDKMEMLYGRFINQIDQEEKRKVLVLSNKQAKELEPKKDYQTLLGRYVKVGNFAFKVVGIYKDEESGSSEAFSSYSAIKGIFGANTDEAGNIEFTFHGLTTEAANEDFEKDYRRRLNANHQAHPEDESSVWLWKVCRMRRRPLRLRLSHVVRTTESRKIFVSHSNCSARIVCDSPSLSEAGTSACPLRRCCHTLSAVPSTKPTTMGQQAVRQKRSRARYESHRKPAQSGSVMPLCVYEQKMPMSSISR